MNYRICKENSASKLEEVISAEMGLGWKPVGGVAVIQDEVSVGREITWAQAMVSEWPLSKEG